MRGWSGRAAMGRPQAGIGVQEVQAWRGAAATATLWGQGRRRQGGQRGEPQAEGLRAGMEATRPGAGGGNGRIWGRGLGRLAGWGSLGEGHRGSPRADGTPRPAGEACWWTAHPASKQRSEGEKVRVGDDLILVSVSSERYLVSNPTPSTATAAPGLGAHGTAHLLIPGPHSLAPTS